MKSKYLSLLIAFFVAANAHAQNIFPSTGSAGIGTTTPNASSILDMVSTSKGMLVPRMTKNQRDAIKTPATGLLIYLTNSTPGFYYYTGTGWKAIMSKAGWSLTGNAGTDPATNFIGTTDAQPLVFKVNNQKAGYLGTTTNTAFGYQTLSANTSGSSNTASGFTALYNNTSGAYNSANGVQALYSNTTGYHNTANGFWSLLSNTIGYYNTATGSYSLYSNSDGIGNTANGISALRFNTHGNDNTADGANALFYNTTGHSNVAVGSNALFNNTTGNNNVAVGDSALYHTIFGYYNTAVGSKALYSNTTGHNNTANGDHALYSDTSGSGNTANGSGALHYNTTGNYNTANGQESLFSNTLGNSNTANGVDALGANNLGNNNTADGVSALSYNTTGSGNTAIGVQALNSSAGSNNTGLGYLADVLIESYASNTTVVGYGSFADASNEVRIGNNSVTSIGGYAGWTTIPSDKRVKKNIKENVPGLAFINELKPVTYNLDLAAIDKIMQRPAIKDREGKIIQPSAADLTARKEKEKILYTGFVAQDVAAAASSINYDFSGVDIPKNDKDIYGLRYSDFVVPLVKAVQELSSQNEKLKKQNEEQQQINSDLQNRLAKLEGIMNVHQSTTNLSSASLAQNIPNPFSNTTTIGYSLPQKYSSAKIIVIDESGNPIKIFNLSGTGKGALNFSSPLRVGASYQYSLLVDGKLIDTKQMVLAK